MTSSSSSQHFYDSTYKNLYGKFTTLNLSLKERTFNNLIGKRHMRSLYNCFINTKPKFVYTWNEFRFVTNKMESYITFSFNFQKGPVGRSSGLQPESYCAALCYSLSTDSLTLCLLQRATGLLMMPCLCLLVQQRTSQTNYNPGEPRPRNSK